VPKGRVYIETMGCQMNVLDSELVLGQLVAQGYTLADDYTDADLALINTCSVRQHAEDKVYSRLGELQRVKRDRPEMILGVIGCMAERDHVGIHNRARHVDLLCGPGYLHELPTLIEEVLESRDRTKRSAPAVALDHDPSCKESTARRVSSDEEIESIDQSRGMPIGGNVLQSYVRVQRGCDKFCTYCIVPYVRGRERSRPADHIVAEVRKLANLGAKEITLLGQTVNSYVFKEGDRVIRFAELLERVHQVAGIERLRFVTSYPGDFTDDILEAMRDLPKVCAYLHIPAQSGSDVVLKRMNRHYTAQQYIELMDRARAIVPGISLAGDFMVGFSGETETDHKQTLKMIERVRYKNIFMFKYSQRPGTLADKRLPDDVPEEVKKRRHADLVRLQQEMSQEHHQAMVGREVEVLVEGFSKAATKAQQAECDSGQDRTWRRPDQLTGRSRGDEIVVFTGPESLIGRMVRVKIASATSLTLHGEELRGECKI